MYCVNCGNEIQKNSRFCPYCGSSISEYYDDTNTKPTPDPLYSPDVFLDPTKSHPKKQPAYAAIITIIISVVVCAGTVIFLLKHEGCSFSFLSSKITSSTSAPTEELKALNEQLASLNSSSYQDEYVDLYTQNHTPASRTSSLDWDKTVFYTLEGYQTDANYTNKRNCTLERKSVRSEDGSEISMDIYLNPKNNLPNKIVALEYLDKGIEVTEVYYTNEGKPNFTFRYTTDNYVATHATVSKDGVRCHFGDDFLINWRIIENGKRIDYTISQTFANNLSEGAEYVLYKNLSSNMQQQFDDIEITMLNYAYNLYDLALEGSSTTNAEARSSIRGRVLDENDQALQDIEVSLKDKDTGYTLYTSRTDELGTYTIYVPKETHSYSLEMSQKNKTTAVITEIPVKADTTILYQDDVYVTDTAQDVEVSLNLECPEDLTVDLAGAKVNVREGYDNYDGDSILTKNSNSKGNVELTLNSGSYTLEVDCEGAQSVYKNITVGQSRTECSVGLVPKADTDHLQIAVSWETDISPDLHIFIEDADGNSNHISMEGTDGFISTELDLSQAIYYKVCLVDATSAEDGLSSAKTMSQSHLTIYVYSSQGLDSVFCVPVDTEGVVWEAFEVQNKEVISIQRYYRDLDEADWWTEVGSTSTDKSAINPEILEYFATPYADFIAQGFEGIQYVATMEDVYITDDLRMIFQTNTSQGSSASVPSDQTPYWAIGPINSIFTIENRAYTTDELVEFIKTDPDVVSVEAEYTESPNTAYYTFGGSYYKVTITYSGGDYYVAEIQPTSSGSINSSDIIGLKAFFDTNGSLSSVTSENTSTEIKTYSQGDSVSLTGTLALETCTFRGTAQDMFILKLDTPINAYVACYHDQNNGVVLHENVTSICCYSTSENAYDLVGEHVSVTGAINGGGKYTADYDENGDVRYAAICMISQPSINKIS